MSNLTYTDLAKMIDHSLLHPTMTDAQVREGCLLARKYDAATVCVKPYSVPMAGELLAGSAVAVCAVAGFPHGNSHTALKVSEAERSRFRAALETSRIGRDGAIDLER